MRCRFISRYVTSAVFLMWSVSLVQAQSFCDLDGADLLDALDGRWSVNQGAGKAKAGPMAMPLPPQPSIRMSFAYDESEKASLVSGGEIPADTFLFPVADADHTPAEAFVAELGATPAGGGCDQSTAPLLTATNVSARIREFQYRNAFTRNMCMISFLVVGWGGGYRDELLEPAWTPSRGDGARALVECQTAERTVGSMMTTMIIRFTGPDAGHGVVIFDGIAQGGGQSVAIFGTAPITLTRN